MNIYIYIYSSCSSLLSHNIEYSSLCYTLGPCCLSILYVLTIKIYTVEYYLWAIKKKWNNGICSIVNGPTDDLSHWTTRGMDGTYVMMNRHVKAGSFYGGNYCIKSCNFV